MIQTVRNNIVAGLYAYINKPVIFNPQTAQLPPYPFVGYSITSDYIKSIEDGIETWQDSNGDIKQTQGLNIEITMSFNAYSNDSITAKNLIKLVRDWFSYAGYFYLIEKGIVVSDISPIQNRDLLEVDAYERREGFELTIRVYDTVDRVVPTIETYSIEQEEN
jgi:hypothetical protein